MLQSPPASPVTAQVSVCVVGRMGAVFCVCISAVGFYASAHDVHGEEGMVFWLVGCASCNPTAFRNGFLKKRMLDFFSLCFSWLLLMESRLNLWAPIAFACSGVQRGTTVGASLGGLWSLFTSIFPLLVIFILLVAFSGFCCS